MIIITNKYTANNPPLFASGHYYSKNYFQSPITAVVQTITQPTVLKNNTGITLLFFREGKGTLVVNSRSYPIQRGMLLCLGSYHYFQLTPADESIELIQCKLSYDTFLYMAANPYYRFSKITLNDHPLTCLLTDDNLKRVELLLEELIETTNKNLKKGKINTYKHAAQATNSGDNLPYRVGKTEFLLCMKLIGILHKSYESDFWSE